MTIKSTVAGIPCVIEVVYYSPGVDGRRGHIDNWLPDEPACIEFEVCDRRGRPAPWLERKLTQEEKERIESEIEEAHQKGKQYDPA